jgi:ubiquinone/menaquinone biosynthesis C-methylase UbiE
MKTKREHTNGHAKLEYPTTSGQTKSRLRAVLRRGGLYYTVLYGARWFIRQIAESADRRLVRIEQRRGLAEPWTVSAHRFTAEENKRVWNEHDWSTLGEEWTRNPEWKEHIIREFLIPHVPEGATVLEVGPGGGRWTDLLQRRAGRLIVVDVAERSIALCRQRFQGCSHIEYLLGDGRTIDVPDNSIDVIWSFDVFVHINPPDARAYFGEFRRILKPGGRAMIHHAGPPLQGYRRRPGWRSDLTDTMIRDFVEENKLKLVSQLNSVLVNEDDTITVFEKPAPADGDRACTATRGGCMSAGSPGH